MAGNVGYALGPSDGVLVPGWLQTWGLSILTDAPNPDAAWEFVRWATSPEFIELVGENSPRGWAAAPPGTRMSTYETDAYIEAHSPYFQTVFDVIPNVPIDMPGTTPRPGLPGIQYVGIPEFPSVATSCTFDISEAIRGAISIDMALNRCQAVASELTDLG